ncbi:MAG: hypothetical protein ACX93T_00910 [Bacteroidota bacterium]
MNTHIITLNSHEQYLNTLLAQAHGARALCGKLRDRHSCNVVFNVGTYNAHANTCERVQNLKKRLLSQGASRLSR